MSVCVYAGMSMRACVCRCVAECDLITDLVTNGIHFVSSIQCQQPAECSIDVVNKSDNTRLYIA